MIKLPKLDKRTNARHASIRESNVQPSFMQNPPKPQPSDFFRSHMTNMEKGSTCRRNPRISTVR